MIHGVKKMMTNANNSITIPMMVVPHRLIIEANSFLLLHSVYPCSADSAELELRGCRNQNRVHQKKGKARLRRIILGLTLLEL